MNARFPAILTGVTMVLAGCANRLPLTVDTTGALPSPASIDRRIDASATDALEQDVRARLVAKGFAAADHGTYLLQITSALVTGKTGLFAPGSEAAAEPHWLVAPSASRSIGLRVITVTLSDRETGREIYRVSATERQLEGKPEGDEQIRQAILAALDEHPALSSPL